MNYTSVLHFLPKDVGGHESYKFLFPSHTNAINQIWLLKIRQVVFEKKMLKKWARARRQKPTQSMTQVT